MFYCRMDCLSLNGGLTVSIYAIDDINNCQNNALLALSAQTSLIVHYESIKTWSVRAFCSKFMNSTNERCIQHFINLFNTLIK